jgi:hypothetical protein
LPLPDANIRLPGRSFLIINYLNYGVDQLIQKQMAATPRIGRDAAMLEETPERPNPVAHIVLLRLIEFTVGTLLKSDFS